jgi:hypothetical protein
MKRLFVLAMLCSTVALAQQKAQIAFKITERDIIPEGITYDPASKSFFVSSIFKKKIMKISETGAVSDFIKSGQDEFLEGLGMKVDGAGRLWACNNTPETDTANHVANVHVFDTKTGALIKKLQIRDGKRHLFNDLYLTAAGDVYVTDSEGGGIYVIRNNSDTIEEFIANGKVHYPNGITANPEESRIYVSTASGLGIVGIDLKTKQIEPLEAKYRIIGLDGLYRYKTQLIGIQNAFFPESILRFTLSSTATSITKIEFVAQSEAGFDIPTTGVIVGDELYFIGNSQLFQLIGNNGKIKNPKVLNETLIMKIKLN